MTFFVNCDAVKFGMADFDSAYDALCNVWSDLNRDNLLLGSSMNKFDFDTAFWAFKQRVQMWFNSLCATAEIGIVGSSFVLVSREVYPIMQSFYALLNCLK